jgi:predicted site-specific integrase-resolvase
MEGFYKGKKASVILKVHYRTLYNWDRTGKIEVVRTASGYRMYNVKKYLSDVKNKVKNEPARRKICYVRVSSSGQKDDLDRQENLMKEKYPEYEIIREIGSGLNFKRPGLLKIINMSIKGELDELVIFHKDRLARFGYELITYLLEKYSKAIITVISAKIKKEPKEELVDDMLAVMNIFTAKVNGMRKYNK